MITETILLGYGLVLIRVFMFFALIPVISESSNFPMYARGSFMMILSLFMVPPHILGSVELTLNWHYILLLLKEGGVGAMLGFMVGLPFRVAHMVGELVDEQRGTITSSQLMAALGEEGSALGQGLLLAFMAYFLLGDGLIYLSGVLSKSFALYPSASLSLPFEEHFYPTILALFSDMMRLLAVISAPMIIVMLMIDLGFGLANRVASSFHVWDLSMSTKAIVSLFIVILTQPRIMESLTNGVHHVVGALYG